jgi:tryptophan 2,3-dioxygenase
MREDAIFQRLEQFPVHAYVAACRASGRLKLDDGLRREASALHDFVLRTQRNEDLRSHELDLTLDFTERFLSTETFLARNGFANYPAYSFGRVLSWALGVTQRCSYVSTWNRARGALVTLAGELLAFERASLEGTEPRHSLSRDPNLLAVRIERLRELLGQVPGFPARGEERPASTWADYALDPRRERALVDLACLPLTAQHDEYLFIRILQMSECCFWGALSGVMAAIERGKLGRYPEAAQALETATWFADRLVPIMDVMKTMPPAHFLRFREETDGSSAIQSRSYQLLQIYTQGVDERKAAILAAIPEISDLVLYADARFTDLRGLLRQVREVSPEGLEVLVPRVGQLDRSLYAYRCVHLGVVRNYIPPDAERGTGGTTGLAYLSAHVRRRLLPIDPQFPLEQPASPEPRVLQPVFADVP